MVARPAYKKFSGLLQLVERHDDMAHDWKTAFAIGSRHIRDAVAPRLPEAVSRALDAHWARIADALEHPERGAERRRRFVESYLRCGIAAVGPGWALTPFLSRRT